LGAGLAAPASGGSNLSSILNMFGLGGGVGNGPGMGGFTGANAVPPPQ
jgi:hypothetical protein